MREHKLKSYTELTKLAEVYLDAHGGNMQDPRAGQKSNKKVPEKTDKTKKNNEENDKIGNGKR